MFKKTITYQDYNGDSVTEDHYFHLDKSELLEMELVENISDKLTRLQETSDSAEIVKTFKRFIELSYGRRIDNGRRFSKSPEFFREFRETGAYSALFMELATDADAGAAFVSGLMPMDLQEQVKAATENSGAVLDVPVAASSVAAPTLPSAEELERMIAQRKAADEANTRGALGQ